MNFLLTEDPHQEYEGGVDVFGVNGASIRKLAEITWSEDLINWSSSVKYLRAPVENFLMFRLHKSKMVLFFCGKPIEWGKKSLPWVSDILIR